jgi:hypothetical protein
MHVRVRALTVLVAALACAGVMGTYWLLVGVFVWLTW